MMITRRAVVAGLAAAAVVPPGITQAVESVKLWGPVYGPPEQVPWPVVRPWMWSRWHVHEHSPGKAFIRHCGSGLTFAVVETKPVFSLERIPAAVQELHPASSGSWPTVDPKRRFAIGHAARFTAANTWLVMTSRRDRPGSAVYFDWTVHDPDGDYFGGAATASIEDAPPLLPRCDFMHAEA